MRSIFGNLFDFNRDGKIDRFEKSMEIECVEECEKEERGYDTEEDEEYSELELADIDPEELGYMDEDECREILEEAGLSPDDFDF